MDARITAMAARIDKLEQDTLDELEKIAKTLTEFETDYMHVQTTDDAYCVDLCKNHEATMCLSIIRELAIRVEAIREFVAGEHSCRDYC